jgi:hypothetical protein
MRGQWEGREEAPLHLEVKVGDASGSVDLVLFETLSN